MPRFRAKAPKSALKKQTPDQISVKAMLRLRPLQRSEKTKGPPCIEIDNPQSVTYVHGVGRSVKKEQYTFDTVFDDTSTQSEVFNETAMPLVRDVLDGRNALLFTYGITNSGKTYTMQGNEEEGGILTRSLDIIFNSIHSYRSKWYTFKATKSNSIVVQTSAQARRERRECRESGTDPTEMDVDTSDLETRGRRRSYDPTRAELGDKDRRYAVFISYVEVYNENIYDLLDDTPMRDTEGWDPSGRPLKSTKKLVEVDGRMVVTGVKEIEVHSTDEALEFIENGKAARQVAATELNAQSSRSHSVFNIRLVSAPLNEDGSDVIRDDGYPPHVAQFSLVDLAGSERTKRTDSKGDRQREAGGINKSLMTLRRCIETLRLKQAGKRGVVPYRDSTLTKLFKNYFAGDGKVVMVVCASPGQPDKEETGPVLKFAARTREVMTTVSTPAKATTGLTAGRGTAHKMIKRARKQMGVIDEEEGESETSMDMSQDEPHADNSAAAGPAAAAHEEEESEEEESEEEYPLQGARNEASRADVAHVHALEKRREALKQREAAFRSLLVEKEAYMDSQEERITYLESALEEEQETRKQMKRKHEVEAEELMSTAERHEAQLVQARDQLKSVKKMKMEAEQEVEEYRLECKAKEDAIVELKTSLAECTSELEACQAEREELAELRQRLAFELKEKENLAVAEMNRKEQEWSKRMGMSEAEREKMEDEAHRATRSKAEYQRRLKMVAQLLSDGKVSEADFDGAAAEEAARQDAAMLTRGQSRKALSTNNPEKFDEKSVVRDMEKKKMRRLKSAPVLNHKPEGHIDLNDDMIMTPKVPGKKVHNVGKVKLKNLLRGGKVKHDKYIIHHQEHEGEHEVFKGDVAKSVSKKGVSVRFTGLEKLTTETTLTPLRSKRKGRSS